MAERKRKREKERNEARVGQIKESKGGCANGGRIQRLHSTTCKVVVVHEAWARTSGKGEEKKKRKRANEAQLGLLPVERAAQPFLPILLFSFVLRPSWS